MEEEEEEEELVLDSSNLIVNYLPSSLTDEGFAKMFERIGPLEAYKLMRNKAGESLAFGFVHYKDPKHGLQAIEAYNGRQREGKTMKVSIARPKQTRESTRDANLYVADLPDSATEDELKGIFENYGKVYNCKLVVNAETGKSRGFAFVLFSKTSEAESAIEELNGKVYPGTNKEMVVKKKDEPKSTNPHLYVANIPKTIEENTLRDYFSPYGEVRNCKLVKDPNSGASKGVAFVHFSRRQEAEDAIAGLNSTRLPGSTKNLIVRPKEEPNKSTPPYQHFWYGLRDSLPDGGWTREETIKSPSGVQHIVHHYVPVSPTASTDQPLSPAAGIPTLPTHTNGGGPSNVVLVTTNGASHVTSNGAPILNGVPLPQPGAIPLRPEMIDHHAPSEVVVNGSIRRAPMQPQPRPAPHSIPSRIHAVNHSIPSMPHMFHHHHHQPLIHRPKFSLTDAMSQPSHQLFVYNLGSDADELALYMLFAPFGAVTKVHTMRESCDEGTRCKGFGFVEMPDYEAAVTAIEALHGMPYKGNAMKPLSVSFKTKK